ncbi:CRISPR-associated helicase Cas3' [Agriterribacter sp.]|uniref:CRISPR-associated helicase Cas3' n=1 Tax=Agriterribacter sp. TaxID=2821509 RepID=UPI002CDC05BE|nr:CRISPR-associated helicase Cas3' [Agriterribacter sp.]HTN08485.1 CRISPR-associated helicase Cas3' [Agriterribacter sp.]
MKKDYGVYWAKDSGETLFQHLCNIVKVAKIICNQLPFENNIKENIRKELIEICVLHDIGKAASGFQKMVKDGIYWNGHRHEILSTAIASQIAPHLSEEALFAILTHHRNILPIIGGITREKCLPDHELPYMQPNILSMLLSEISHEDFINFLSSLQKEFNYKWQCETISYDVNSLGKLKYSWLKRDKQLLRSFEQRKKASLLRGLLITCDHLASAWQLSVPRVPKLTNYTNSLIKQELKGDISNLLPFQQRCGMTNGSIILKAPTGSGKTFAMLFWASSNQKEKGRLFYTLPYTASINAMYKRLQKVFPKDSIGVLHHKNAAFLFTLLENENNQNANKNAKHLAGLAHEMYFPIKVLTPHQILRISLRGKGWELGLTELQNACFIFDEIHACEPLITGLIVATAKWLQTMGANILLASATFPKFLENIFKEELYIYPDNIIEPDKADPKDKKVCDLKRHKIVIREGSLLSNLPLIIDDIVSDPQKTILIICNYVATSQEVCDKLEKENIEYMLLHSRFNSLDRNIIEETITSKNPPRVLVATQAIEVSLDVDYDCGYTEPAPIDALAQRFGRINRKGSRTQPSLVTVFEKESVENGQIYDKKILEQTVLLLKKQHCEDALSEQDIVSILNEVYSEENLIEWYKEYNRGKNYTEVNDFENVMIAGTHEDWTDKIIEKSDGQIEILPFNKIDDKGNIVCLYNEYIDMIKQGNYIKARMLLVSVRIGSFQQAKQKGLIRKRKGFDVYVTELEYSSKQGLNLKKQINTIW